MVITATHISARLAWHADGWNGHICKNPRENTYCIGQHSYPGDMVVKDRDLDWETKEAGSPCSQLDKCPPCIYSVNAFGKEKITAYSKPPEWFNDESKVKFWDIDPATICIWPYEEMYKGEVKFTPESRPPGSNRTFDYDKRLDKARRYFNELEPDKSLIFYYANYSNPFSEDETKKYVIVGVSRFKKLGEYQYYDGVSQKNREKYAGAFVWQLPLTSNYPDEGFRIPYHLYMNNPEVLEKLVLVPDNQRNFKYATRRLSDDEALAIVEYFLEIVNYLIEIDNRSENWEIRRSWLEALVSELWKNRGAYPGLSRLLKAIGFNKAIPFFKERCLTNKEKVTKNAIFDFLNGKTNNIDGLELNAVEAKNIRRSWLVRDNAEKTLISDILPLFDLSEDQFKKIISPGRQCNGIESSLNEILDDPYIICEQFIGDDPDDNITFNKIDHGMIPSPDLGLTNVAEKDDWRRLRALVVERLKHENRHTFLPVSIILHDINKKLSYLPDWKAHQFNEHYFTIDEEELSRALVFRELDGRKFVYLKHVFDDEKLIGDVMRGLVKRKNISLMTPVTDAGWRAYLYDSDSSLAMKMPKEYENAIKGQIEVCRKILDKPVCVISGEAGTGKTTVINALILAIEKTCGRGVSIKLLAPTGKAADRIREKTGRDASTIHSFLASNNWLNDNLTFRRIGGRREEGFKVIIVDESSMLDLELVAALFRSINWNFVQRLIFVGDPNQLPPIGRGKVFADIIDWLNAANPESVTVLKKNIRQIENTLSGHGTGILELASVFVTGTLSAEEEEAKKIKIENMLQKLQEEGDIDRDLRVEYWRSAGELEDKLKQTMIRHLQEETKAKFDHSDPFELLNKVITDKDGIKKTDHDIIISPYRGEFFGTENINLSIQEFFNGHNVLKRGTLGGISLFDKVIQVVNRGRSNSLICYDAIAKTKSRIEVYNGEIGYAEAGGSVNDRRIDQLQVVFARKPHKFVQYNSQSDVEKNLELAYAISVHKAQGSEFSHVYFILPKNKKSLLSTELLYTGITRAKTHLTLFIEEDSSPILTMSMPCSSQLRKINSSIFDFKPIPDEFLLNGWFEEGKIYKTLTTYMVRSMSEVVIANILFDRDIPFKYEKLLYADDGSLALPDFTITWNGEEHYWEHVGRPDDPVYMENWARKEAWYEKYFPGKLIKTVGSENLSEDCRRIIGTYFAI